MAVVSALFRPTASQTGCHSLCPSRVYQSPRVALFHGYSAPVQPAHTVNSSQIPGMKHQDPVGQKTRIYFLWQLSIAPTPMKETVSAGRFSLCGSYLPEHSVSEHFSEPFILRLPKWVKSDLCNLKMRTLAHHEELASLCPPETL